MTFAFGSNMFLTSFVNLVLQAKEEQSVSWHQVLDFFFFPLWFLQLLLLFLIIWPLYRIRFHDLLLLLELSYLE